MIRNTVSFIGDFIKILWWRFVPYQTGSARRMASEIIKKLQKQNKEFKKFKYRFHHKIIAFCDQHLLIVLSVFLVFASIPLLLINLQSQVLENVIFSWLDFPTVKKILATDTDADNYHSVMSTIQATVMSLIIPITIALHEFVLKDKKLKDEMISFIFKEARVRLISMTAISFLIWIGFVEYLKVRDKNFLFSGVTSTVEMIWFTLNLLLILYFMFITLKMLNRNYFDSAMAGFIANDVYPKELKGYLVRNIFLNINKTGKSEDE